MPAKPCPATARPSVVVWAALCLVAAVALVFCEALNFGFVNYDDDQYVYQNPHVTSGLSRPEIAWAFSHGWASNWHPLTWISHMADWQLYGDRAGGHHLTSIILHALSAALLFWLLFRMTGNLGASWLAAAMFAIHPLRVESVAWVAERKDVLSGLFFMLTLLAYVAYSRRRFPGGGICSC